MKPATSDALKHAVDSELSLLVLAADRIEALYFSDGEWSVTIEVRGHTFQLGWVHRDGWCCCESTDGKKKEFVPPDTRIAIRDDDRLRKEGLAMVRYAIEHPDFEGVTRPVI